MSIFNGKACFSPSVGIPIRNAWISNGGTIAQSQQEKTRADYYFCSGFNDNWLSGLSKSMIAVFDANWISDSLTAKLQLPLSTYVLDNSMFSSPRHSTRFISILASVAKASKRLEIETQAEVSTAQSLTMIDAFQSTLQDTEAHISSLQVSPRNVVEDRRKEMHPDVEYIDRRSQKKMHKAGETLKISHMEKKNIVQDMFWSIDEEFQHDKTRASSAEVVEIIMNSPGLSSASLNSESSTRTKTVSFASQLLRIPYSADQSSFESIKISGASTPKASNTRSKPQNLKFKRQNISHWDALVKNSGSTVSRSISVSDALKHLPPISEDQLTTFSPNKMHLGKGFRCARVLSSRKSRLSRC
ncbi:hypothetical protein C8Q75DRAFT_489928 [Abortiporus biennis]|nr:hypothetical protein C8Q75DRAFT_489928 [Abortiporus biennis]